jgi:hypothetical protein
MSSTILKIIYTWGTVFIRTKDHNNTGIMLHRESAQSIGKLFLILITCSL